MEEEDLRELHVASRGKVGWWVSARLPNAILGQYRHASLLEFCLHLPTPSGHELDMFTLIATMLLLRICVDPIDHL
jgi:hypothetical protein